MNPFQDFLKAVRTSMARKLEAQISLPSDITDPAHALSAKFYSRVPAASLREYLQGAAEREDYALCALIHDELLKRAV